MVVRRGVVMMMVVVTVRMTVTVMVVMVVICEGMTIISPTVPPQRTHRGYSTNESGT